MKKNDRSVCNDSYFEHSIGGQGHPIECPFTIKSFKIRIFAIILITKSIKTGVPVL